MIRSQLLDTDHYLTVDVNSGIKLPTKKFGSRTIPIPLGGGIEGADFLYGAISNSSAEVKSVTTNEGEKKLLINTERVDFRLNPSDPL